MSQKSIERWTARVYLLRTDDRENSARELTEKFNLNELENKRVAVKANFNSINPFPATTHPGMLRTILEAVRSKTDDIVIAEKSERAIPAMF